MKSIIIFILSSLLLTVSISIGVIYLYRQTLGINTNLSETELLSLINLERTKIGVKPLSSNPELTSAALAKANAMISANLWSHNLPTSTPWTYVENQGYKYILAGENLAKDFNSSEDVVIAWLNSPSHKTNMLFKDYTEAGIAVVRANYQGKTETNLIVLLLATPLTEADTMEKEPEIFTTDLIEAKKTLNPILFFIILSSILIGFSSGFIGYKLYLHRTKKIPSSDFWKH